MASDQFSNQWWNDPRNLAGYLGQTGLNYLSAAQPSLQFFMGKGGDPRTSGLYQALLTSGLESTSRQYDAAKAGARRSAQMRGFGYTQPAEQGMESQIGAEEAGALARAPNEALLSAAQPELAAAEFETGAGENLLGQGATYRNLGLQKKRMDQQQQSGLWRSLAGAGLAAAAPFTGGASLLGEAALGF